jgi:hypothetical protein
MGSVHALPAGIGFPQAPPNAASGSEGREVVRAFEQAEKRQFGEPVGEQALRRERANADRDPTILPTICEKPDQIVDIGRFDLEGSAKTLRRRKFSRCDMDCHCNDSSGRAHPRPLGACRVEALVGHELDIYTADDRP